MYIETDNNTSNLVELLLLEIKDLNASVRTLQPNDKAQLFTEKETAYRLCISVRNLVSLRKNQKIHFRQIGASVRYSLDDILEFEESCRM